MGLFEVLTELVLLIHLLWILWVILGWIVTATDRCCGGFISGRSFGVF
jgi:hypothetical protein